MKIGSININGVNAFGCTRVPGKTEFFNVHQPDILCLQEVKGDSSRLNRCLGDVIDKYGYAPFTSPSKGKNGYSGTAMLIKKDLMESPEFQSSQVTQVELYELLDPSSEVYSTMKYYGSGRITQLETDSMYVISLYTLNSGSKDELRKLWDTLFIQYINKLDKSKKLFILGDFNVCHTELDMWNWRNSINSFPGLMEYEIDGFSKILTDCNLIDSYRNLHPTERKYSWSAPKVPLSKGWRLDYALTNKIELIEESNIISDVRCSDHVYIEITVKD